MFVVFHSRGINIYSEYLRGYINTFKFLFDIHFTSFMLTRLPVKRNMDFVNSTKNGQNPKQSDFDSWCTNYVLFGNAFRF